MKFAGLHGASPESRKLKELATHPEEFIGRLRIVDEKGQERYFDTPFSEQVLALQDFMSPAEIVIHYKPRQIGDTTVATAYNFNYLYWATDPARCLVVADGYYEWQRKENDKIPHYFTREDDRLMFFAGIYKDHQFLIITGEASSHVADIHQRQPVVINEEDLDEYFNLKTEGTNFLRSYQAPKLKFHPVSKDVNKPTNNNKQLIEAIKN